MARFSSELYDYRSNNELDRREANSMPSREVTWTRMIKLNVKSKPKWNRRLFEEPPLKEPLSPSHPVHEILNKDIFNESDLEKMTPDYQPSDLVLRMEVRSSMIRHNHTPHALIKKTNFKTNFQNNKNVKEISRVSQELSKIKQKLQKKNIKNNAIFKNYKTIPKKYCTPKKIGFEKHDFETEFINDEISFISELENNFNSEREILSEIDEPLNCDADSQSKEQFEKTVTSSDDIEDLQTALTLMTLYSSNDDQNGSDTRCDEMKKESEEIQGDSQSERSTKSLEIVATNTNSIETTDYLKIMSLSNIAKEEYLAKKYFFKWRKYMGNRNGMSELRKQTLNSFFEKLMKQKCELKKVNADKNKVTNKAQLIAHDQSSYQHRYQVQKNIIALQKLKLEEQNRLIDELKYNRIVEASKESTESMRDVLKGTISDMDRRMKPKIKCLTNELKLHDIEEPALVLHCLKVPQFLQRMEKRAREREERHALIRERRRQMEEERLRLKQQAELSKAEMDKEEKERRMKELKEKRKQEKIESIRRKQHAERMRAFRVMADLHYERNLVWHFGLKPWLKLIEMKKDNIVKAVTHYDFQLKKNVFLHWLWHTEDMWMERNYKAEDFYRKKILRKTFGALKMNHHTLVLKQQVADDYYDLYVQQLVFRRFRENVVLLKKEREVKWNAAVKYYESNTMFRVLTHWRVLPALNRLQRERDARKSRWRQKVLQVVPDYTPPDDD